MDQLVTVCSDSTVATAAGIDSSSWSSHVFVGTGAFIGARNRGNIPFIDIFRTGSSHVTEMTDTDGYGGTSNHTIQLNIWVPASDRRNERTSEELAWSILNAINTKMKASTQIRVVDFDTAITDNSPFARVLQVVMTIEMIWKDGLL
jgi:hypothetical protein